MRHYVVPYSYRKRFQTKFKTHLPHDIVLLCIECHIVMDQATKIDRTDVYEQLYRKNPESRLAVTADYHLKRVKSCARALWLHKNKLPHERIVEYEKVVYDYYVSTPTTNNDGNNVVVGGDGNSDGGGVAAGIVSIEKSTVSTGTPTVKEATATLLVTDAVVREIATTLVTERPNPHYIPLPELFIQQKLHTDQDVRLFVRGWRQFFVDTLHPRYLPMGWSVTSPVEIDDNDDE